MEVVHKLVVKNVSPVKAISMHTSQRMCLALYGNGVLRLWNMLDGRCTFKIKVGIDEEEDSEEELAHRNAGSSDEQNEDEDDYSEREFKETTYKRTLVNKYENTPTTVKWEPIKGIMYAVLFSKKLEIYSVESEEAIHCIDFDTPQTDFCFVSETALIVAD